jgi:D-3-phosphoglycerate dehydrogenase
MTPEGAEARPSVVVTARSFGTGDADPAGLLQKADLRVERADAAHDHALLEEVLSSAVAWIAGTSPIDDRHLAAAPNLRIVARYGTGYDSVDLAAAARRGVMVTNTPGANAEAVADHTVCLMLAALRHLIAGNSASREGVRPPWRGRELGALTVGIVGFGSVGRTVARRLVGGFGTRVLAYDPFVAPERAREAGVEAVDDLSELAREADVLTLHMPGGGGAVVDAAFLSRMRPGAVLINTARGDLLDEEAVVGALAEGRLSAAAVDVLASEPAISSPLLDAPNTIITPHIAAQTTQAIDRMGMIAAEEVVRVLAGDAPRHPVPVPT